MRGVVVYVQALTDSSEFVLQPAELTILPAAKAPATEIESTTDCFY